MIVKNIIKRIFYRVHAYSLDSKHEYSFFYIFHTEAIYDDLIFQLLKSFCSYYYQVTNKFPLCIVIPGNNPLIQNSLLKKKVTEKVYVNRIKELSTMSHIGYHGHFYSAKDLGKEIKPPFREKETISKRFTEEINWFINNEININGCYTGGWWYTNEDLMELLHDNHFNIDFTFTYNLNFRNDFSKDYLKKHTIPFGQPFIKNNVKYIQTLSGCHNTYFIEDFIRNFNLLVENKPTERKIIGALSNHDYNLRENHQMTIACIDFLTKQSNVSFLDLSDIDKIQYTIIASS